MKIQRNWARGHFKVDRRKSLSRKLRKEKNNLWSKCWDILLKFHPPIHWNFHFYIFNFSTLCAERRYLSIEDYIIIPSICFWLNLNGFSFLSFFLSPPRSEETCEEKNRTIKFMEKWFSFIVSHKKFLPLPHFAFFFAFTYFFIAYLRG